MFLKKLFDKIINLYDVRMYKTKNKTKHKSEQKLMIRAYKGQVVLCYMLPNFCQKFVLFSLSFLFIFYLPPITVNCCLKHMLRLLKGLSNRVI